MSGVSLNTKPNTGLDSMQSRQAFFQKAITRMATHWNDSEAVKAIEIDSLDKERETILKAIALAMDVSDAWSATRELIVNFMPYMERRGHWDEWHEVLEKAIVAAQVHDAADSEITFTALLARLCLKQSRFKESVQLSRKVITVAKKSGNKFEEARACSNLGFYFIDKGHWWRSEVLCCHALQIFEELKSAHGLAHTHNHLGLLYQRMQKLILAEKHLQLAGKFTLELDNKSLLSTIYGNLGAIYINNPSRFDEAEYYTTNAIEMAELSGEKASIAILFMNLAIAHREIGAFEKAFTFLEKAEKINIHYGNSFRLAQTWHNFGELYLQQNNYTEGKLYLEKAIDIFSSLKMGMRIANAIDSLVVYSLGNNIPPKPYIDKFVNIVRQYRLQNYPEIKETYKKLSGLAGNPDTIN